MRMSPLRLLRTVSDPTPPPLFSKRCRLLYEDRDAFVYPWHLVKSPRSGSPYGAEEGDEDRAAAAPLFTRP